MSIFLDDRDLLDDFRAGERYALAAVCNAYIDDVSTLVRLGFALDASTHIRGISDPEEQREVVQEVFVRALSDKARLAYDGLRPYRPYLLRIAKNLMIDRARKISRRPSRVDLASSGLDIDDLLDRNAPFPEPEEDMAWRQQREATLRYMKALTPELQEFVQHRFVDCESQTTVSKALGITRRRVRTLERRCLRGLIAFLDKEGLL